MTGLFAGAPPLKLLRAIVSEAATMDGEDKVIEMDDDSHASFEAQ